MISIRVYGRAGFSFRRRMKATAQLQPRWLRIQKGSQSDLPPDHESNLFPATEWSYLHANAANAETGEEPANEELSDGGHHTFIRE